MKCRPFTKTTIGCIIAFLSMACLTALFATFSGLSPEKTLPLCGSCFPFPVPLPIFLFVVSIQFGVVVFMLFALYETCVASATVGGPKLHPNNPSNCRAPSQPIKRLERVSMLLYGIGDRQRF